jgi:hypothetical protein
MLPPRCQRVKYCARPGAWPPAPAQRSHCGRFRSQARALTLGVALAPAAPCSTQAPGRAARLGAGAWRRQPRPAELLLQCNAVRGAEAPAQPEGGLHVPIRRLDKPSTDGEAQVCETRNETASQSTLSQAEAMGPQIALRLGRRRRKIWWPLGRYPVLPRQVDRATRDRRRFVAESAHQCRTGEPLVCDGRLGDRNGRVCGRPRDGRHRPDEASCVGINMGG